MDVCAIIRIDPSALASDVQALAEEAEAIRLDSTGGLRGLAQELQGRLTEAEAETASQLEKSREEGLASQRHVETRLAGEIRTTGVSVDKVESELRVLSGKVRQLEAGVEVQREDLTAAINQRGEDCTRRLEALGHAVKVFSDMANGGAP